MTALNIEDFERPFNAFLFAFLKVFSDNLLEFTQIWKVLTVTSYIDILMTAAAFAFLYGFLNIMIIPLLDAKMSQFNCLTFRLEQAHANKQLIPEKFTVPIKLFEEHKAEVAKIVEKFDIHAKEFKRRMTAKLKTGGPSAVEMKDDGDAFEESQSLDLGEVKPEVEENDYITLTWKRDNQNKAVATNKQMYHIAELLHLIEGARDVN